MPSGITVEAWTGFCAQLDATPPQVREFLEMLPKHLAPLGLSRDAMENALIVLAEVLNNVVEHAYEDRGEGNIDVRIYEHSGLLTVEVHDAGTSMPGLKLPEKHAADIDVARNDLPEGGFGWFFIHELVEELSYSRMSDRNLVRFGLRIT